MTERLVSQLVCARNFARVTVHPPSHPPYDNPFLSLPPLPFLPFLPSPPRHLQASGLACCSAMRLFCTLPRCTGVSALLAISLNAVPIQPLQIPGFVASLCDV